MSTSEETAAKAKKAKGLPRAKRQRRDSIDEEYAERPSQSIRAAVEAHSRPRRGTRKTTTYEDLDSGDELPPKIRRLSESTASSLGEPKTPPSSHLGFPDPHIASSPDAPDTLRRRVGDDTKARAPLAGLGIKSLALDAQSDDAITRWIRDFSLPASASHAAHLILEHLNRDATFAFLDTHLRTASAFSLALLLLQWHPGPIKFTKRTGISFADVEWSRRMLLAHEPTFRRLLVDAKLLPSDELLIRDDVGQ